MNDPLQDNRIYPDEIKQETKKSEKKSSDLTWLWTLLIILVLIAVAWFGYRYFINNRIIEPTLIENTSRPNIQEQQETFNSLEASAPALERAERQQKINTLFGN